MGIPKYHKWLTDRYPQAFAEKQTETAEHVYVDVNALLHEVMRKSSGRESFFYELFKKLDRTFRSVVPTQTVFLAIDGPASCAKCLTQRERRRAHFEKDSKTDKKGKGAKGKWGKGKGKGWGGKAEPAEEMSNNMLTPGVPFMVEVSEALEYYSASRMARGFPLAQCRAATVSGANAIGEGEHKIVSQLLRHAATGAGASEAHVIISGDADIFLLSLVQSAARRVRVVSERPLEGADSRKRKWGGPMLTVWDAEVLARCVVGELPRKMSPAAEEASVRRDFALVSLLAGNDYLPPLACGMAPQNMWQFYLKLRRSKYPQQPLVEATPTAEGLPPSHLSDGWAAGVGDMGGAFAVEPYEELSFFAPLLKELMAAAGAGAPAPSGARSVEGVRKYLTGLLWVLTMYHHGYCGDFYFVFEKSLRPFASASLAAKHLDEMLEEGPLEASSTATPPMRPLSCALCILPVQHAERFLCPAAPELREMFAPDHELLGSVNSRELSTDIRALKSTLAGLNNELMSLRSLGRDDTAVKRQITQANQQMQAMKSETSDIDVVPLWEVDAEVVRRCGRRKVASLNFAPDVTLLREGAGVLNLTPPVRAMGPARCPGLSKSSGEWPPAADMPARSFDAGAIDEEAVEEEAFEEAVEEEVVEEEVVDEEFVEEEVVEEEGAGDVVQEEEEDFIVGVVPEDAGYDGEDSWEAAAEQEAWAGEDEVWDVPEATFTGVTPPGQVAKRARYR